MKKNGFSLIEPLLGLAIFSLFLHLLWETQSYTSKSLSDSLKTSRMQSTLNQWHEALFAYPDFEINDRMDYEMTVEENENYRIITLCSQTTKTPCLSTVVLNPKLDFQ
jgi:type II secretory pathway component PulJ